MSEPKQQVKRPKRKIDGWLCLDKPLGLTSTQALGKARWLLSAAKAGHGGTLDPLASGILPLAFGEATKTVEYVMDADKTYHFTLRFGEQRSTDDAEGEVVATSENRPSRDDVAAVLAGFTGEIQQRPPVFSALKVAGQRAYDLARRGDLTELPARAVHIYHIALLDASEVSQLDEVSFEVTCGKGTYIRSLARDIAQALNTVGHVSVLRRTRVGQFSEESAVTLEEIESRQEEKRTDLLLPIKTALHTFPFLHLSQDESIKIRQGQRVSLIQAQHRNRLLSLPEEVRKARAPLLLIANDKVIAIAELVAAELRTTKVFNL